MDTKSFVIPRFEQFECLRFVLPEIMNRVKTSIDKGSQVSQLKFILDKIEENEINVNDAAIMVKLSDMKDALQSIAQVVITNNPEAAAKRMKDSNQVKQFNLSEFVEEAQLVIDYYARQKEVYSQLEKLQNLLSVMGEAVDQYGINFVFPEYVNDNNSRENTSNNE